MALEKRLAQLLLTSGLDTSTDVRLGLPSKLDDLRDGVFGDATPQSYGEGTAVRRGGLSAQTLTTLNPSSTALALPFRMATNNGQALVEDFTGLHAIVKDTGQLTVSTHFLRGELLTRPVSGNVQKFPNNLTAPLRAGERDFAFNTTKTRSCWAWVNYNLTSDTVRGRLSIGYAVIDEATGATLHTGELYTASYVQTHPRVVYSTNEGEFFIYYAKYAGGDYTFTIESVAIPGTGAVTVSSPQLVFTSSSHSPSYVGTNNHEPLFDVTGNSSTVYMVVRDLPTSLKYLLLNGADGYTTLYTATFTPSATVTNLAIARITGGVSYPFLAVWGKSNTTLVGAAWDGQTGLFTAETTLNTPVAGSSTLGRITAYETAGSVFVAYDSGTTTTTTTPKMSRIVGSTLTISTEYSLGTTGWLIAGRLTYNTYADLVLPLFNSSDTQPTVYLIRAGNTPLLGTVLARVDYGECGYMKHDWATTSRVPETFSYNYTVTLSYPRWVTDAQIVAGEYVQPTQVWRGDFDLSVKLGQGEVNGLTYLAGGCPHIYDGQVVVEEGFHHAPEITSLLSSGSSSGNLFSDLPAGTYYVTLTMGWQDARGNWHESAPAEPQSVTVVDGGVNVAYSVPPTLKERVQYLWYRTIDGAATGPFYRAFDVTGTTITDDDVLVDCEQLYTVPGVEGQALYHDPMPACRHIEQHHDRFFMSGCEDGYTVFYSNQAAEGRGVEFSTLLQKRTDYEFGRVVATQSQDGKLVVLGERKIGVLLGQGPSDTGEQDGYSDIEAIVHNEGARWTAPKSVCTTNEGVWFQNSKGGIRLFSRSNEIARRQDGAYIGVETDNKLGAYLANAVVGDNTSQLRFYHSGGGVLVYDLKWLQWSRFSNHTHVDACYADGRFYHVTSTPKLLYYDESVHTDDGTAIEMVVESPWLSMAGIQGFQRVYRALFLGGPLDSTSDTQVATLHLLYDFNINAVATTIAASDITASSVGLTQFEHQPAQQKCETIKLVLYIKSKANASRFRLSNITLQVGVKQGKFKLPAARRV